MNKSVMKKDLLDFGGNKRVFAYLDQMLVCNIYGI